MLKKIVAIRNVGRFRNSAAPGNPQLLRHTLILGANGYGKTTLCAVLRSLRTGDASIILGRKTLGTGEAPAVELLLDATPSRFNGAAWSAPHPAIAIFDDVFVAENVHSGEVVELDHKRNLYRVIIGEDGVRLSEGDAKLAADSRAKTGEISAAARAIQPHVPAGMKLEAFIALPATADIDVQITGQERTVAAIRQTGVIKARAALSEFALPVLPAGLGNRYLAGPTPSPLRSLPAAFPPLPDPRLHRSKPPVPPTPHRPWQSTATYRLSTPSHCRSGLATSRLTSFPRS